MRDYDANVTGRTKDVREREEEIAYARVYWSKNPTRHAN